MKVTLIILAIGFILCTSCSKKFEIVDYRSGNLFSEKKYQETRTKAIGSTLELVFYESTVKVIDNTGRGMIFDKKDENTYQWRDRENDRFMTLSLEKKLGYIISFTIYYQEIIQNSIAYPHECGYWKIKCNRD